jgi:hypothetical protein
VGASRPIDSGSFTRLAQKGKKKKEKKKRKSPAGPAYIFGIVKVDIYIGPLAYLTLPSLIVNAFFRPETL